jgi:hypothetical protein
MTRETQQRLAIALGMTIGTPELTYQYDQAGYLSQSSGTIQATSDAPERFRERFTSDWSNRPGAWSRVVELVAEMIDRLDDQSNRFGQELLWLVGLGPMPAHLVESLEDEAARSERARRDRSERVERARTTGKPVAVNVSLREREPDNYEEGPIVETTYVQPDGSLTVEET